MAKLSNLRGPTQSDAEGVSDKQACQGLHHAYASRGLTAGKSCSKSTVNFTFWHVFFAILCGRNVEFFSEIARSTLYQYAPFRLCLLSELQWRLIVRGCIRNTLSSD